GIRDFHVTGVQTCALPIFSRSLQDLIRREPRPPDLDEDIAQGLAVISARSEALARFMSSYARLARLPPPQFEPLDVKSWVRRVEIGRASCRERVESQMAPV